MWKSNGLINCILLFPCEALFFIAMKRICSVSLLFFLSLAHKLLISSYFFMNFDIIATSKCGNGIGLAFLIIFFGISITHILITL